VTHQYRMTTRSAGEGSNNVSVVAVLLKPDTDKNTQFRARSSAARLEWRSLYATLSKICLLLSDIRCRVNENTKIWYWNVNMIPQLISSCKFRIYFVGRKGFRIAHSHMYTPISNIRALKYLELLLRLGCALNFENEFHFATRYKFCRWWQDKLS